MKITNRFYCGAKDIITMPWAKPTEHIAIEHARHLLQQDPERKYVAIVKIVALVRRADTPIQVLKVT